jgi:polar amino acid transport system ATP-binding protein
VLTPETAESVLAAARESPLLRVEGLGLRRGAIQMVTDADVSVGRGEVVAIIGPSGAGKSSLLRCLNLLEVPNTGSITLNGDTVFDSARRPALPARRELMRYRQRVGMVFQQFNLFPHLTAVENISLAQVHVLGRSKRDARLRAEQELEHVGLTARANAKPATCSGGERQRIAIARALAMDPELMLFDEPTSAIDPELVVDVLTTMQRLAAEGMTMIVVTHEMSFAEHVADRVIFMADGKILETGAPSQVLRDPQHPRTARFISRLRRG